MARSLVNGAGRSMQRAVAALTLLCAGCPHPPIERPYAPPSPAQLAARAAEQLAHIGTLRSAAKVDYLAERGERVKLRMTFVVQAPDRLRIEAESPLGGSVASLASDGRGFQLLDVRGNRFLTGDATACNIARLIRIGLRPADVVAVVAGGAPWPAEVAAMEAGWDGRDGGREVLTVRTAGGAIETVRFDARQRRWDVAQVELRGADGKIVWRIDHADFADAGGGVRLPGRTEITQPARDADARVRWKSREPAASIPMSVFQLDAPAGLPAEIVTCSD